MKLRVGFAFGLLLFVCAFVSAEAQDRIEQWRDKTVMVFTPHPDDDLFGCGGTLALLAKNSNKIIIVIYTNDNKGSFDLEMTSERLARIRKAEEEAAMAVLGIPKENLIWLGYEDGELEYAPPKILVGQATRLIRQYRPDVLFSVDPGEWYERWHKSDHRMGGVNTIDAVRAAEFHLYYPEHLLTDGLKPYKVPLLMFYYAASEANYWVDIADVVDQKINAVSKHVSQFEPSINKYRPDWDPKDLEKLTAYLKGRATKKDGRYVEAFRRATGFNQQWRTNMRCVAVSILLSFLAACHGAGRESSRMEAAQAQAAIPSVATPAQRNTDRVIHVLVALCDNQFQGIVPVPARIGNGDDPANNLYWGAAFGVKTFFKRSREWTPIDTVEKPTTGILERVVFKHRSRNVYLVADAYRGREIKLCVRDFFEFAAGRKAETLQLKNDAAIHAGGGADLIAYVGHDGLMDFSLDASPEKLDDRDRDAIILACISKRYFAEPLRKTGANPLLWTTGLMAPESYVLKAAIDGWMLDETGEKIRRRAAAAYNQYQRCGSNAALRLFSSGW